MRRDRPARQHGALIFVFCIMLLTMLAMFGLALDLALVYNRKAELQALADATALAAARELNGTADGVANALSAAADVAASYRYEYNSRSIGWSDEALRFADAADAPDAAWVNAAAAQLAPASLLYARVDTRGLNVNVGRVAMVFMQFSSMATPELNTVARAVAGRMSTPVLPLAICAQSNTPAAVRVNVSSTSNYNELVEYGFRRGVAYDLMQLNPNGTTPAHFLIDPLAPPGKPGQAAHFALDVVGPAVCAGSMPIPAVTGGAIAVQAGFPLASLYHHLNSRFDDYDAHACTAEGAPPDTNVKPYEYGDITWMSPKAAGQTAATWTSGGARLWTRADPLPGDSSNTAALYGPLWAYARAVPYANYTNAPVEPANGYATFAVAAWSSLYTPNPPAAASYPSTQANSTPYIQTSGSHFLAPASHPPGLAKRRVLYVPLLSCPVSGASATVLGVGRFFMTVKASNTSLPAEFAGMAPPGALRGVVELLP